MYLSKLEILGFKSFAQKVTVQFDSGLSAIVGPNGCGKTNIVDAIRWVLGEQRYSALRSEKMEDVIFNGTKARKPLGMAEASLIIENTKGILPSEYSQVTIGRRVFRSGDSEYLLNKVPCRLKDIQDLFMDTGMGADAYSVIELKMVETILSDKTDERRRLFEEAAGVTKYKHRRKAAYRKLEAVQADLMRVNDIVSEIQKAVNSLERQARKAEQYNDVKSRLTAMEIDLMEREYANLLGRVSPMEERLATLNQDQEMINTDLSKEELLLETHRLTMLDVEKRLADVQRELANEQQARNRVEQQNLVARERLASLERNVARFRDEEQELAASVDRLHDTKESLSIRISELTIEQERVGQDLSHRQDELAQSTQRVEAKKNRQKELNDRTIQLLREIGSRHTVVEKKKGQVEHLHGRAERASQEIEAYQQEILRVESDIEENTQQDKVLRRSFAEAEMEYYNKEMLLKELKDQGEELQVHEIELKGDMERLNAHADFLKALIESREGFSDSVRFLARNERWKPARNVTLVDAVSAEERFRKAIEATLGEYAGLIVVDSAHDAHDAITLLRSEERGKATFVCLDELPEIRSRYKLPSMNGIIGWASDLVQYDVEYTQLFRFLLDRVVVVEDAKTAARVTKLLPGIRSVTLEGEISTGFGITRGGSTRKEEGGLIGKQSQIEELQKHVATLHRSLEEVQTAREDLVRRSEEIDLKSIAASVKSIEKDMASVEMRIAQLEFEKRRAGDIITKNDEEILALNTQAQSLLDGLHQELPELDRLNVERSDIERNAGAVSAELEAIELEWNQRSTVVNDLGILLVTTRGKLQNAHDELQRAETSAAENRATRERRLYDITQAEQEISNVFVAISDFGVELQNKDSRLAIFRDDHERIESELNRVREEIHRIEQKIREERHQHDESLKSVHELELKIADLKAKADHIIARAREEFETEIELKSYPEDEFVDFAALRQEIQVVRDKIKSLGNINFAAFEEYTSEKERFDFLTGQRADLLDSEKALLATIEEINTTAQQKFMSTFDQIRANFIDTFKSLFDPGDECDLILEEGVDPLEAAIDIMAKPRGKRPTSIHLLSGGEKTLTAIALLFAIYLVKPSPFCILDEVDAPLDDANIDRYTRILRKFSNNTQFIVVTHNKRTMEAASALYGVTMEEEGVSKLVTVRFNEGAEVKSAELVSG